MASQDPVQPPRRWSGPIQEPDDPMTVEARPRIEIDEALDNGWIEMWYQPKIDLKRKCLAGAEVLARIRHPELGVLLPGSFLPGVTAGSIARLTEHALVCRADELVDLRGGRIQSASVDQRAGTGAAWKCRSRRSSTSTGRNPIVGPASSWK